MNGFPQVPLGEVLTQVRDEVAVVPGQTYRPAGIYSFGRGLFARPPITGAETKYRKFTLLQPDQFVYSKVGSWEGALTVSTSDFEGLAMSPEYPVFEINSERALPEYLRLISRWEGFWELLAPRGSMVRRKRVHPDRLLETAIPLPPLDEQRRVADWLEGISGRVDRAVAARERTDELTKALTGSCLATLEGSAPQVPLGEVLTQARDEVAVEADQTYRLAGIYSFGRGLFARPPIQGSDTKYKKFTLLQADQFVYSKLKGWEGAVAMVPDGLAAEHVSSEYPTFDLDRARLLPSYLDLICRWEGFWAQLRDSSHGVGARRERVHPDRLLATPIPLPPLDEQQRIGDIGRRLNAAAALSGESRTRLDALAPATLNEVFGDLGPGSTAAAAGT